MRVESATEARRTSWVVTRATRTLSAAGATLGTLLLLVPVAAAEGGGVAYGSPDAGGTVYGAPAVQAPPQARMFSVSPRTVTAPKLPTVRFSVDQPSARTVAATVVFSPVRGGKAARVKVGRVRAGRVVTVRWPRGFRVVPGRYTVRLLVTGRGGQPLARGAGVRVATNLVVKSKPKPKPSPAPAPAPTPAPSPAPAPGTTSGIFPVRGPHTYGDRFGAARSGYTHEGQDVVAAQGTPIVAPVAGSILYAQYQDRAGWYVVQHADDGRDFFYAHCATGSVVVKPGQRVAPGARLCDVGATGDATGPHLHFEIWVNGWRTSDASKPIDPLPQLQAWEG
jgi:murein DD-endopeptidase MepM/ murein hydrolase activator NlpD